MVPYTKIELFNHHEILLILLDVRAQQNKLALKLKQKRQERMQLLALRQQQENEEHYKKVNFIAFENTPLIQSPQYYDEIVIS